ncbi:MAG: hypothetical protein ACKO24_19410 [Leptolyngbyaceae cyanobacterium]
MSQAKKRLLLGAASLLLIGEPALLAKSTIAAPIQVAQVASQTRWKAFQGQDIQLSLPANFQGGSPTDAQSKTMIESIKSLGNPFATIGQMVEKNPAIFALVAVDPQPNASGGVTNVLVSAGQQLPDMTLKRYVDALAQFLPAPIKVLDHSMIRLQGRPAGRLVTEAIVGEKAIKQTIYIVQQADQIWTVAYSTDKEDYPRLSLMFERSIQTFRAKPS